MPKTKPKPKPRRRRCAACEELKPDVIRGLCEECEGDHVYCTVCEEFSHRHSDLCRHLSWTDNGFTGAGAEDGLDPTDLHKEAVLLFFDLLDTLRDEYDDNLARSADREIRRHRFFTQMRGWMLSTPDLYLCRMRLDLHKDTKWLDFGRVRKSDMEGFDHDTLSDAFDWLSTLDEHDTVAANRLTAKWLDEWWAERKAGRRVLPAGKERVPFLAKRPDAGRRERKPPWAKKAKAKANKKKKLDD